MTAKSTMTARCRCGGVEIEAIGAPIVSTVCYCADCQTGSRQIEALPTAGDVRDADGGTAYILFRKDRLKCSKGAALLKGYKIKAGSVTNRLVATCCNSAMVSPDAESEPQASRAGNPKRMNKVRRMGSG